MSQEMICDYCKLVICERFPFPREDERPRRDFCNEDHYNAFNAAPEPSTPVVPAQRPSSLEPPDPRFTQWELDELCHLRTWLKQEGHNLWDELVGIAIAGRGDSSPVAAPAPSTYLCPRGCGSTDIYHACANGGVRPPTDYSSTPQLGPTVERHWQPGETLSSDSAPSLVVQYPATLRDKVGLFMLNRGVKMGVNVDPSDVQDLLVQWAEELEAGR